MTYKCICDINDLALYGCRCKTENKDSCANNILKRHFILELILIDMHRMMQSYMIKNNNNLHYNVAT